jgi:hypothetical protein
MFRTVYVIAPLLVAAASSASAQTYPDRPVRILVPYSPGGITDIAARVVGAKPSEYWGHQVIVENRSGGNGLIAMSAVVKADPDGYTLVMASGGDVSLNPAPIEKMPNHVWSVLPRRKGGRDLRRSMVAADHPRTMLWPQVLWRLLGGPSADLQNHAFATLERGAASLCTKN